MSKQGTESPSAGAKPRQLSDLDLLASPEAVAAYGRELVRVYAYVDPDGKIAFEFALADGKASRTKLGVFFHTTRADAYDLRVDGPAAHILKLAAEAIADREA